MEQGWEWYEGAYKALRQIEQPIQRIVMSLDEREAEAIKLLPNMKPGSHTEALWDDLKRARATAHMLVLMDWRPRQVRYVAKMRRKWGSYHPEFADVKGYGRCAVRELMERRARARGHSDRLTDAICELWELDVRIMNYAVDADGYLADMASHGCE